MRPRSVVPGRQRWEIEELLGRPDVAQRLVAGLREQQDVAEVSANSVTGRLLIFHDLALSSERVDQLVRQAVGSVAAPGAPAAPALSGSESIVIPAQVTSPDRPVAALALAGIGAVVFALFGLPLLSLGIEVGATVLVVRRAWRRPRRSPYAPVTPSRSGRPRLSQLVGSHKIQFYLASFLSVLGQMLDMLPAFIVGWIALVLTTGRSATLVRLGVLTASGQIWFLAGTIVVTLLAYSAVSFISSALWRDLAHSVQHEWRSEMYSYVQRAPLSYLEGERTSRLARVLSDDIDQFGHFLSGPADYLLSIATSFLVLLPTFLVFAPGIAWIAFLTIPYIVWLSFSHQARTEPDHATSSEAGSIMNSQLLNNLEASATIKSFGAEDYEIERIRQLSQSYRQASQRITISTSAYSQTVRVCATASFAGTVLLGGLEVLSGQLPFAIFIPVIGLPQRITLQLPRLGDAVEQYHRALAALGRVQELRNLPVESAETGRSLEVSKVAGEMVLEDVTFAYPGRPPVLENVTLRIAAGKTTAIVGATGAGKTTIAKLILRFQDVSSGRVLLDGSDIRELRLRDLRSAIGFVGQDPFLFDGTVGDNVRYGSFNADTDAVVSAARVAAADGFVEALPLQYDSMVGERGVTLSGGQRQRISLARAVLKGAPILILDEATSAVDNETEEAIQRALREFAKDRTLVIIAHRLSTIRNADCIYVIGEGGVIVDEGTHHELLERDGVYASLWRLQIGESRRS